MSALVAEQSIFSAFYNVLFQVPSAPNPAGDSRTFVANFEYAFGLDHVNFELGSYQTTVAQAFRQTKLMVVYLHSPIHEDSPTFCRNILCSPTFISYIGNSFLFWGGSVADIEAYSLSNQLECNGFPYLAVFSCRSESEVQVIDKFSGLLEEQLITDRLSTILNAHNAIHENARREVAQRTEATSLREQQDREYHEAMERDRQARLQAEEEERRKREAEQLAELNEAIELSRKLDKEAKINRIRTSIPVEPDQSAVDAATIRFQLPLCCNSVKLTRRFRKTDRVEDIYNYIHVWLSDAQMKVCNVILSSNFPKKDITDMGLTVEEAGLFPRAALHMTCDEENS